MQLPIPQDCNKRENVINTRTSCSKAVLCVVSRKVIGADISDDHIDNASDDVAIIRL